MDELGIKNNQSPILWDNVLIRALSKCIGWNFQFRAVTVDSKSPAIDGSPIIVAVQDAGVAPKVTSNVLFCNGVVTVNM
jgi:hypothetical protein